MSCLQAKPVPYAFLPCVHLSRMPSSCTDNLSQPSATALVNNWSASPWQITIFCSTSCNNCYLFRFRFRKIINFPQKSKNTKSTLQLYNSREQYRQISTLILKYYAKLLLLLSPVTMATQKQTRNLLLTRTQISCVPNTESCKVTT